MNKTICQSCSKEISNEFGVTLSFCTNCGAAISSVGIGKTLELKKETVISEKPKSNLFTGLIIGAAFSALLFGAAYLFSNYFASPKSETNTGKTESSEKSSPWIKLPAFNSVSASEITKVAFSVSSHAGPLVGSDESYTTSSATSFSNDGVALKSTGAKNYDTGKKPSSPGQKFQGVVSKEQFQKLAQTLADEDISNLKDSSEIISDVTSYTLIVSYAGKTKIIRTSNTGKDTDEIKTILQSFENLEGEISWTEIRQP